MNDPFTYTIDELARVRERPAPTIYDEEEEDLVTRKAWDRLVKIIPELENFRRFDAHETKYLYHEAAKDLFKRIGRLKKEGKNKWQIKEALEKPGGLDTILGKVGSHEEAVQAGGGSQKVIDIDYEEVRKPVSNEPTSTRGWEEAVEGYKAAVEAAKREADAKDKTIQALAEVNRGLKQRLLQLPAGRSPEEIKAALEAKEEQAKELVQLRKESEGKDTIIKVKDEAIQRFRQRLVLLDEYTRIKRKWWKGKRLREIVNQLSRLEAES